MTTEGEIYVVTIEGKICAMKHAVEAMGWGPGRTNYATLGGKGG